MKILKKIGTIIAVFLLTIKTLALKVLATVANINGITVGTLYGVEQPVSSKIVKIFSTVIIPIILLIGLIIYFIKSKRKEWVKVAITIGVIILYILFGVIIDNI